MPDVDAAVLVQADCEGFVGGFGAVADARRAQEVYREDRGFAGLSGEFVVAFQGEHCGPAGVVAQGGDDVWAHLVLAGCFPGAFVPGFEQFGRDSVLVGVLLTPFFNGFGQCFVVSVLGDDRWLAPFEALDGAMFGDVGVIEAVEFTAELFAYVAGLACVL